MQRRSTTGGDPVKTRRGKAATPKRGNAPKVVRGRSSPIADLQEQLDRRTRELHDALEQQTAAAEVLGVISRSAFDLQAVFETVVERSARLSGADLARANIYRFDGELLRLAATFNVPDEVREWLEQHPFRPGRQGGTARAALERRTIHIPDISVDPEYSFGAKAVEPYRTVLGVPILKGDDLLGVLLIYLLEVKPFTDKQIALVEIFADQAAIAIESARLFEAEQQRTRELTESLEQQTATANVLEVISRAVFDLQAVFETVVDSSARLCGAERTFFFRVDGDLLRTAATFNVSDEVKEWFEQNPIQRDRQSITGRCALARQTIHIPDTWADPEYTYRAQRVETYRTFLAVPVLKGDELLGVISLYHSQVRPFTDRQIALVETFANQAAIAIENVRLFEAEQQRTRELSESLEQQTATSEVLQVISSSPGDLQPVFAAMLENATRICEASFGAMQLREGDGFRRVALHNAPPEFLAFDQKAPVINVANAAALNRIMTTKQIVHTVDLQAEEPDTPLAKYAGARTLLVVPLLKENEVIGAFGIYRQEVCPFTDKQIALVASFASQAVIAIENARLLNELRQRTDDLTESLEQQTATSEVLSAISSSPSKLDPVFQTILANATRICEANFGLLHLNESGAFRVVATHNVPPAFAEFRSREPTVHPSPKHPLSRVAATKEMFHVPDIRAEGAYIEGDVSILPFVDLTGARTVLVVPMLKENDLIGTISIYRQEVPAFSKSRSSWYRT